MSGQAFCVIVAFPEDLSEEIPRERNLGLCSRLSDERGVAMCREAGFDPLNSAFSAPVKGRCVLCGPAGLACVPVTGSVRVVRGR